MAIGINWAEIWAADTWAAVWQQTAPVAVDGGGKIDRDELIDYYDLQRRLIQRENNARAALLLALAEADVL